MLFYSLLATNLARSKILMAALVEIVYYDDKEVCYNVEITLPGITEQL